MVVDEALVLEVLYNKDYSIRQIRHETVWTDYVPKKQHALECVPILFKSKQTKNNDVIKFWVGVINISRAEGKVITYNYATYPLRWASLPITLGNFAHPYGQSCPTQWADSDKAFR